MYQKAKKYLLEYTKQKELKTKKSWADEDVLHIMIRFTQENIQSKP